jgi:nucleotide-binding universal stress UspA family protein
MKLLIPTDFSELSKIAIRYALGLSKDVDIDIVLLHVVNSNSSAKTRIGSKKLQEAIKSSSEQDMNDLLKTLKDESNHSVEISTKIYFGGPIHEVVEAYALKHNIDLICIGTKGATGLKKMVFGSNASGIISNSSIPVLTIPEYARYKGVKNMVYSSDLEHLEKELNLLIPFAKLMHSWVNILHINRNHENSHKDFESQEDELKALCAYDHITTKTLRNESVIKGINQYVADIDADMVAMFTRKTSLFEKLFTTSVTQNAAFQTTTPLLTFQKK